MILNNDTFFFCFDITDVVTEFIEGLVETYPGLQYLDGFPEVMLFILIELLSFPLLLVYLFGNEYSSLATRPKEFY